MELTPPRAEIRWALMFLTSMLVASFVGAVVAAAMRQWVPCGAMALNALSFGIHLHRELHTCEKERLACPE